MFIGEEPPGAAHAGLHLVENQEQLVPVADVAQAAQKGRRDHSHAALALDRLDQDRARSGPDRRLDRVEIGQRNLIETVDLGPKAVQIFRLAAGGDGGERAPVKGALEGQNPIALRMAAD